MENGLEKRCGPAPPVADGGWIEDFGGGAGDGVGQRRWPASRDFLAPRTAADCVVNRIPHGFPAISMTTWKSRNRMPGKLAERQGTGVSRKRKDS